MKLFLNIAMVLLTLTHTAMANTITGLTAEVEFEKDALERHINERNKCVTLAQSVLDVLKNEYNIKAINDVKDVTFTFKEEGELTEDPVEVENRRKLSEVYDQIESEIDKLVYENVEHHKPDEISEDFKKEEARIKCEEHIFSILNQKIETFYDEFEELLATKKIETLKEVTEYESIYTHLVTKLENDFKKAVYLEPTNLDTVSLTTKAEYLEAGEPDDNFTKNIVTDGICTFQYAAEAKDNSLNFAVIRTVTNDNNGDEEEENENQNKTETEKVETVAENTPVFAEAAPDTFDAQWTMPTSAAFTAKVETGNAWVDPANVVNKLDDNSNGMSCSILISAAGAHMMLVTKVDTIATETRLLII